MIRLFLITGVFVFLAAHAEAASFDCKKAKTEVEKTICAARQLSALDEKLAETYRSALAKLSPAGQRLLREGQRQWLKALSNDCAVKKDVTQLCIEEAYNSRLRELTRSMVQVGEFLFTGVDLFRTQVWTGADGEQRIYKESISYPRIDSPRNAETARWNEEKKRVLEETLYGGDDYGGHFEIGYGIAAVNGTIITLAFYESDYSDGMAHAMSHGHLESFDTSRSLYPLTSVDFFAINTDWQSFLVRQCLEKLKIDVPDILSKTDIVKEVVSSWGNWIIGKEGLSIIFASYTIDGYPSYDVLVPWPDLQPYLLPDAPIPK